MSGYHTTYRRRVGYRRHLDLVPTVTTAGQAAHHAERAAALARQRYQTGPRFGQELALEREDERLERATRPEGQSW